MFAGGFLQQVNDFDCLYTNNSIFKGTVHLIIKKSDSSVSLDYFVVSSLVLEISVVEISAFSLI